MNDSTYTIHVYDRPVGTQVGGYPDPDGAFHTIPVAPDATYDGDLHDVQAIVRWATDVADTFFGAENWDVTGTDITVAADDGVLSVLRVFAPGSDTPIDLGPYVSYLGDEENDEDEEQEDDEEVKSRYFTSEAPALTPSYMGERFAEIVQTTGQALFDNIVANVPTSEDDLRERFEQFGLLA